MEDKVIKFHQFALRARRRHNYKLSHIWNMDETPMWFELPATRTLEFTGNRTVPILSCVGDEQSFTVVLALKSQRRKTTAKSHFRRHSSAANPNTTKNAGLSTQERLDGWRRYFSFLVYFPKIFQLNSCSARGLSDLWHFRYRSSDNKYVLIRFAAALIKVVSYFFFCRNKRLD